MGADRLFRLHRQQVAVEHAVGRRKLSLTLCTGITAGIAGRQSPRLTSSMRSEVPVQVWKSDHVDRMATTGSSLKSLGRTRPADPALLARAVRFTAEACADEARDVVLLSSLRYAHSERHLRTLAAEHGFAIASLVRAPLRQEQGRDVEGQYVVLRR